MLRVEGDSMRACSIELLELKYATVSLFGSPERNVGEFRQLTRAKLFETGQPVM